MVIIEEGFKRFVFLNVLLPSYLIYVLNIYTLKRYSSASPSPTLGRNEKVKQYIRKKTHKPNALRFWVKGDVIPLYVGSILILV